MKQSVSDALIYINILETKRSNLDDNKSAFVVSVSLTLK
ncbi:hypothetical protein IWX76_001109 [Pedobacter sp. CAN_A7]